jgi:hypothetical protein
MIESFNTNEDKASCPKTLSEDNGNTITLSDIFTSEFMKLYTQFESIEELLSSGGFVINSEADYDAIPDKDIDAYVTKTTNFRSWKEMLSEAANDYLQNGSTAAYDL